VIATRKALHAGRCRRGSTAGQVTLRAALFAAAGTIVLALGFNATSGHASVDSFTWTGASSANWSDAGNWTCTGTCTGGNPISDPSSDVTLPAGKPLATTLDASATVNALTVQDNYTISGAATTLTAASLSSPSNTLGLNGTAPSGVTLVAPVAANATQTSVQGVTVAAGNSLQTTISGGCGPSQIFVCLGSVTLSGTGPASASNPGALVANSALDIGSLTVTASTAIGTGGNTVSFDSLTNDPAATVTTKGAGALEFGAAFDLHNLDFNIAANGALDYTGTANTVTLNSGATLGNKTIDSNIAARGAVTLAGDANVQLADGSSLETLTLTGSPQIADNSHTLTVLGSNGGELIMDSANQTTGTIAVGSGATLHASGTLHAVSLAGTGGPHASPADALALDGNLTVASLTTSANAKLDLNGHQLTASTLANPAGVNTLTVDGTTTAILGSGTGSSASNLSLTQSAASTIQAGGNVTVGNITLAASGVLDGGTGAHTLTATGSLILNGDGATVAGNGSTVVAESGLIDHGHSLTVSGSGSFVTLTLQGTNTTNGSAAPTGTIDVASGNTLKSASALNKVQLDGGTFEATGSFTLAELKPTASSTAKVDPSKTLTVTTLDDTISSATLTFPLSGTALITNDPALTHLDLTNSGGGILGVMGSVHAVTLSPGAELAANGGDLTLSGALAISGAGSASGFLAGGDRTITLTGGITDSAHTLDLTAPIAGTHGVTAIATGLSLASMDIVVEAGSTLRGSGSVHALSIAGQGPLGVVDAVLLNGTLSAASLTLTGDASIGLAGNTFTASTIVNPGATTTLTLDGAGQTTIGSGTTTSAANLNVVQTDGSTIAIGGLASIGNLTLTGGSTVDLQVHTFHVTGSLTLNGDSTVLGNAGSLLTVDNGLIDNGHGLALAAAVEMDLSGTSTTSGDIAVDSGNTLVSNGVSLNGVSLGGVGTTGQGAFVANGNLSLGFVDFLGDATASVGSGNVLTVTTLQDVPNLLTLIGSGTMAVTNPNLSLLSTSVGGTATLETIGSSAGTLLSVNLGVGTALQDASTFATPGLHDVSLTVSNLSTTGTASFIGGGTKAAVSNVADGVALVLTAPGGTPPGVTVTMDNTSQPTSAITVMPGSALLATGVIDTVNAGSAGPSGGGAVVVDSTPSPGSLTIHNLNQLGDTWFAVNPGTTLTVSASVSTGGSRTTLLGPGAFSGPATVNLPDPSALGILEVGGGVVVNGGTITTPGLDLHGGSRLQPAFIDFTGSDPAVTIDAVVTDGAAQLGHGGGGTSAVIPSGSTLHVVMSIAGSQLTVPATIVQSGSGAANLTVTGELGALGTAQLSGNNTYTGTTTVGTNITLLVDGSQPGSDVQLNGGTLGGHGTVGAIIGSNGGIVAPDVNTTLTAANPVNLGGNADRFFVVVGSGGTSALDASAGGAVANPPVGTPTSRGTLLVTAASTVTPGTVLDILQSPTATGAFTSMPDGTEFFADGQRFKIRYNGGSSGHDITLTALGPDAVNIQLNADHNPQTAGQPVTFTALLSDADLSDPSAPTGTVKFFDGTTQIGAGTVGGGAAHMTTSALGGGAHQITAHYGGDVTHQASVSSTLDEQINQLATTVGLASAPINGAGHNSAPSGTSVIFTATITTADSAATGTVTFYDGVTTIGSGTVSSDVATFTTAALSIGIHEISATYNGDFVHLGNTSNTLEQHISAPTTTSISVPQTTVPTGSTVDMTVHVASATAGTITGTVTCFLDSSPFATPALDAGGMAQCTTPALTTGTHVLLASYGGDDSYTQGQSSNLNVYTLQQSVTLSTDSPASSDGNSMDFAVPAGTPITFSALVSGNSGPPTGTVTFFDGGSSIGSASLAPQAGSNALGQLTTTLPQGLHVITARYGGDAHNGQGTSNTVNQFVTLPTTTVFSISANPVVRTSVPSLSFVAHVSTGTATPAPLPSGTVTFLDLGNSVVLGTAPLQGDGSATLTGVSGTHMIIGVQNVTATYNGDNSWSPSTSPNRSETVLIPTATAVVSSVNPVNAHRTLGFTVTVTSGSGTPTGSVTLADGSTSLGSSPVDGGGHAHFTVAALSPGVHTIGAAFTGTGFFGPSTGAMSETVIPPNQGYWLVASDGGIFPFGAAGGYGSTGGMRLNQPIVGMAATPDGRGYWLVAGDGGIFPFGDAGGHGSTGGMRLNQPIVGMAATPSGNGYWLVAADGGIFPFGDAGGYGSTGGIRLNQPIVGMTPTPSGHGYWLVASDGGIFPFGDATGLGSTGGIHLNQPIVGMQATPDGGGYWLVAADGGIFPFGDAVGLGSTGGTRLNQPIVGMEASPSGNGYWLVAADGGIFPFGDAVGLGSTGGTRLNRPVVGMGSPLNGFAALPG